MTTIFGPSNEYLDQIHAEKHRAKGETFRESRIRLANALSDTDEHFLALRNIFEDSRFLPGGRIQASVGTTKNVTPHNCYVSGTIYDSFVEGSGSIMMRAREAAATMRMGGGIGYDFSPLRPRNELIKKLGSQSSGPISFMHIFDAVCLATASSGHRRGAQMGVLRIDHPDIEEFIRCKQNKDKLTGFNISVAVTDEFMDAVISDKDFSLRWADKTYRTIRARDLWDTLMRSTYDWAEPGVLFIDRINSMNNLYYCETIAATNPCGEQPLPPYGACLLGSFNLPRYLVGSPGHWSFNYERFILDIPHVVRGMDNVIELGRYPLQEQEGEAQATRRMGLGITGAANAIEALGFPYGSPAFISTLDKILFTLANNAYKASALLAAEKGKFPRYIKDKYIAGPFVSRLQDETRELIAEYGMRNSHLLSIAPTGTISLCADNVSSGIEPVFAYEQERTYISAKGPTTITLQDYGYKYLGVSGKRASECTVRDHLEVLICAQRNVDSAVSKTCNVPQDYTWDQFKNLYLAAWKNGCKGCTTYRMGGMRDAILISKDDEASCSIDPVTGRKNCE